MGCSARLVTGTARPTSLPAAHPSRSFSCCIRSLRASWDATSEWHCTVLVSCLVRICRTVAHSRSLRPLTPKLPCFFSSSTEYAYVTAGVICSCSCSPPLNSPTCCCGLLLACLSILALLQWLEARGSTVAAPSFPPLSAWPWTSSNGADIKHFYIFFFPCIHS